jgi:predicted metal-dependent peptidase
MKKIQIAMTKLLLNQPFFASLALHLKRVEDTTIPTAATDSVVLKFNPDFIDSISQEETIGLIAHEVLHVAMLHPFRRNNRNHRVWNMACDYAVNPIITSNGLTIPEGGLQSDEFKDMSAEEIYEKLIDKYGEPEKVPEFTSIGDVEDYQPGSSGEANSSKDTDDDSDEDENTSSSSSEDGKSKEEQEAATKSAANADKEQGNEDQGSAPNSGDYSLTAKEQEENCKVQVNKAAAAAKSRKTIPAGMKRQLDSINEEKLSWKEILARFITENSKNDYRWKSPNKRYLYTDLYLPSLEAPKLGTIGIACDTSGSVQFEEVKQYISEVKSIAFNFKGTQLEVVYFDTKVYGPDIINGMNDDINPKGGGGTDFVPPLEHFMDNEGGFDHKAIIVFTDGMCYSFPEEEPDIPVLWVIDGYARNMFNPPFGEVVYMEDWREE